MKQKFRSIVAVLTVICIVFSTFAMTLSVSATDANAKEYFVKQGADSTAADGTETKPFADIGAAVSYAANNGSVAGDTVTVTVIDDETVEGSDTIAWGTFPESFGFALKIRTQGTAATVSLPEKACFAGDTEFDNIIVKAGGSWPSRKVFFGGYDVKFGTTASLSTDYVAFGCESGNIDLSQQTVEFKGTLSTNPTYIYLPNETGGNVTRSGDVNLKLNSANGVIAPSANYGSTTFAKNVNLDLTNVASTKLIDFGDAGGWTIKGAVQIICNEGLTVTNEELLTTYAPEGGVYKIINDTGVSDLLEFVPDTAGKYKIIADTEKYDYTVKDSANNTVENAVADGYITLDEAGTYTVTASKKPVATEFFVKSGADATVADGTKEKPFADIGTAVSYAVNNDYTDGDTVTVTILDNETVEGADTVEWGTVATHDFKLMVKSDTVKATVNTATTLGGDTEFSNVTLIGNGTWPERNIFMGGYNVKFDENTTVTTDYLTYAANGGNTAISTAQTVEVKAPLSSVTVQMSNYYGGNRTFEKDVNLVFDNASSKAIISLNSHYGTTTFKKNINIDIRNASSYEYKDLQTGGGWTIEGALQLIHKDDLSVDNTLLTNYAPAGGIYEIINATEFDELLEFVPDTAGKYKIIADTEKYTYTVKKNGVVVENAVTKETDGVYITLSQAGTYTVEAAKNAVEKELFVKYGAAAETADGTKEKPFADIASAVTYASSKGLVKGDTVTLTVLGTEQVSWGTVPDYSFKMVVRAETEGTAASVAMTDNTSLSGDVSFKDIKLTAKGLLFNDHDVTFDKGTEYSVDYPAFGTKTTASIVDGQTVIYKGKVYAPYTKITNDASGNKTYTDDVNIIVDNAEANLGFYIKSNYGATTYTEDANLNLNVKSAKAVKFINAGGSVTHNGAIQIIYKQGFQISGADLITAANPAKGVYWIVDDSGCEDLLDFTDTVGKYKFNGDTERYTFTIKDKNDNTYPITTEGGVQYLVLPAGGGTFTITATKEAEEKVVYVKANATDGDGSVEAPFATVSEAMEAGIALGLIKSDTLTVKVLGTEAVSWGTPVAYAFSLNVQSATSDKGTVDCTASTNNFTGDVVFKDIIVKGSDSFFFNDRNITFDKGAELIGVTYLSVGTGSGSQTATAPKISYSGPFSVQEFKLGNNWGGATYTGDFEVTFDNASAYAYMMLGGNNGTATYENINVNLKNAAAARITKNAANSGAAYTLNGAVQIINTAGIDITLNDEELANIDSSKKWLINNESGIKDLLSFAENTAGKFTFDANKYTVTYTAEGGTPTVCTSGELVLAAGVYTVTAQVKDTAEGGASVIEDGTVDLSAYGENVNLEVDNEQANVVFDFGTAEYKKVKINVKNAASVEFKGTPKAISTLEVIVKDGVTVTGKDVLSADEIWYVTDKTGKTDAINFTEEEGIFDYIGGFEVVAVSGDNSYLPDGAELRLLPGEYSVSIKEKSDDSYSDYIKDRGNGLKNTYAKLSAGEKVNVAYLGGSVTVGTGSTNAENKSWRGRVGHWLENIFPNADVNNINLAYGGTGTKFGVYRMEEVISRDPDLIFIEYSINDYYAAASAEDASMRFETIVRKLREALPECDIVTILVTEKNLIDAAKEGKLHLQAQAHEDIAEKYNIPSIHVGRALADALPDEWAGVWDEYSTDIVHLTDKGYDIYYKAIEEYLKNSLIYGDYNGEITEHTVPGLVSDALYDGDIKYIDASNDLITKSEALGGSGYVYSSATGNLRGFAGYLQATAGADSEFVIEFTGTELSVVEHSNLKAFMIKVDDGEYNEITPQMSKPVVLVSGLEYGEHTVYIKPVCTDATGNMSWFQGFFTRNEEKATHKHIYADYEGNDDATCRKNETETGKCTYKGCTATDTRDIPDSYANHKYTNYEPNGDATCQKLETETATCDYGCGASNTRDIADSYAEHKYSTYTPNGDAACGKNETETATCDYGCGTPDTRDIADTALDHVFDHACDTDCNREGCNHTRETTHVYDGPSDLECNTVGCGYTRPLGAQIVEEGGKYYYYYDGVKSTATALVDYEGKKIYVKAGEWTKETNLVKVSGVWYYINEGVWDTSIDTLHKINGKWFLIKGGIWKATTGLVEYKGKTFYVKGGKWTSAVNDLIKISGKWYYIKNGKWDNTVESLHKINGKWFLIKDGMWKATTGLVKYKGKYFYVKGGKWSSSVNTLYKKSGKWFAIKSGKWNTGKVIITYSGKKFYCNKGYAQLKYSGKVKIGSKTYTVKKGVVK